MNGLQAAILGVALFGYFLYQQCVRRPVTRNDFLLPGIAALFGITRYLGGAGLQLHDAVVILTAALVGVGTGLLSGQMIRVWRDQESGLVYQFGGWRYVGAFLALLLLRVAMRVVADRSGFTMTAVVLNDAFIGMMVGNFLGRAVNVGVRAMTLLDWRFDALPHRQHV
ncbi:MAG: hypothetical protein LC793_15980, partial [Thermomicrobia bacterium]|nr:hypothetical protein [Thermomicrobia bacterium]